MDAMSCFLTPHNSHFSFEALLEKKQIEHAHTLPLISKPGEVPVLFDFFDCVAASLSI